MTNHDNSHLKGVCRHKSGQDWIAPYCSLLPNFMLQTLHCIPTKEFKTQAKSIIGWHEEPLLRRQYY